MKRRLIFLVGALIVYRIGAHIPVPGIDPAALAEFAAKARELRHKTKRVKPAVTIRITPECLSKYKALGKGYTGIMADVLNAAADNADFLTHVLAR